MKENITEPVGYSEGCSKRQFIANWPTLKIRKISNK
jgi:hypothetical protein